MSDFLRAEKSQIGGNRGNDLIEKMDDTVDGQNPANQLRLAAYPIIYDVFIRVLYIPGGCLGFLPSTVFGGLGGYLHSLKL